MKRVILLAAFIFSTTFSFSQQEIEVNIEASTLKWKGSKIYESHEGTISIKSGYLVIDERKLTGGQFLIDMTTIKNTDIESDDSRKSLEDHLKNEDFFNVEEYEESYLKIINAESLEDNMYKIEADLEIKGITNRVNFTAEVKIRQNAFLAIANIKIDRTKWDIVYKSGSFFSDLGNRFIFDEIEFEVYLLSDK